MRVWLGIVCMAACSFTTSGQMSYKVSNTLALENKDCDWEKICMILPVPVSNNYQRIDNLVYSSGEMKSISDTPNRYLRDTVIAGSLISSKAYALRESFHVTLYPMYIDMDQFSVIHPYDTTSTIYQRYTADKGVYIDTHNASVCSVSERLWNENRRHPLNYARACYEYVAKHFRYLHPDTGLRLTFSGTRPPTKESCLCGRVWRTSR